MMRRERHGDRTAHRADAIDGPRRPERLDQLRQLPVVQRGAVTRMGTVREPAAAEIAADRACVSASNPWTDRAVRAVRAPPQS